MTNTVKILATCASLGVSSCTQMQDKCDTPKEAESAVETSFEVVNLVGEPVKFQLGDGEEVTVPGFERFKVVGKATSGLKTR